MEIEKIYILYDIKEEMDRDLVCSRKYTCDTQELIANERIA